MVRGTSRVAGAVLVWLVCGALGCGGSKTPDSKGGRSSAAEGGGAHADISQDPLGDNDNPGKIVSMVAVLPVTRLIWRRNPW